MRQVPTRPEDLLNWNDKHLSECLKSSKDKETYLCCYFGMIIRNNYMLMETLYSRVEACGIRENEIFAGKLKIESLKKELVQAVRTLMLKYDDNTSIDTPPAYSIIFEY